jgi:hypothetical protein
LKCKREKCVAQTALGVEYCSPICASMHAVERDLAALREQLEKQILMCDSYASELNATRAAFTWYEGRNQGLNFDAMFGRRLAVSRLEDQGYLPATALLRAHEERKR